MKGYVKIGRDFAQITQLGLSISIPIILSVWIAGWIAKKFELGIWVILIGIVLGLGGAGVSAVKFYQYVIKSKGGD